MRDAQRNLDALLRTAIKVFKNSGVDAPVREIAEEAGVGVATLYRHFPHARDLISAVFRREVDACADAAPGIASEHQPAETLRLWLLRYADFIGTKRGLATALHSDDPAFDALPDYFDARLRPALQTLLDTAVAAGQIRADVDPEDLLRSVAGLSLGSEGDEGARAAYGGAARRRSTLRRKQSITAENVSRR